MTVIDLTLPVTEDMPIYPSDPAVRFERISKEETGGFVVHKVTLGTHTGTHLDAPAHGGAATGADHPRVLDATVGEAMLITVEVPDGCEITPSHIAPFLDRIEQGDRIIIRTGWSAHFGKPYYFTGYPSIALSLVDLFADRGIRLLGIDTPSVHNSLSHEVHQRLFESGIIIVENLVNLDRIPVERFIFVAAPLPLEGLDGSPVRALAIIDDEV